ncbi:MAG: hypothetical protein VX399_06300 [SAR324 cluster bacterium]|nr:hypothetical protein [SAR324 cluster bacterium]
MDKSYACIYHLNHMAHSLYHRFLLYWQIILFGVSANFLFTACFPPQVEFEAGWATKRIEGKMLSERGNETGADSFIIVLEYFSRFVQLENHQALYIPRAKLVRPEPGGRYEIYFDLRASAIEAVFIADGYKLERFRFQRQTGIGELRYKARMKPLESWREHFILEVSPFLENFILEPRYKLAPSHQLFIGDWLNRQREHILVKEIIQKSSLEDAQEPLKMLDQKCLHC